MIVIFRIHVLNLVPVPFSCSIKKRGELWITALILRTVHVYDDISGIIDSSLSWRPRSEFAESTQSKAKKESQY